MNSRMKCVVCGYIVEEETKVDRCRICGAGQEKFVLLPAASAELIVSEATEVKYPRIDNVVHADWIPREIRIGKISIEIKKILPTDGVMEISKEHDCLLVVLSGQCKVTCEGGFSNESFIGETDEEKESMMNSEDEEKKEGDGGEEGNKIETSVEQETVEGNQSEGMSNIAEAIINAGTIITIPKGNVVKIENIKDEHLVILIAS